jgi:hypothetical protein
MVSLGLAVWITFGTQDFSAVAAGILLAPCLAALVVYVRPRSLLAQAVALVLVSVAIVLLLIGFAGLLYLPTWLLLVWAFVSTARQRVRRA